MRNNIERLWLNWIRSESASLSGVLRMIILWPMSLLYRFGFAASKAFSAKPLRISTPIITVGGMTVGGAGKTPFVALLVRLLQSENKNVAVVCSGYGRKDKTALIADGETLLSRPVAETGDEPRELAEEFPNVFFAVCESKREAVDALSEMKALDVIIVDDGFQTRGIESDLTIALISSQSKPADFRLLPSGRLREPLPALKRADIVVYSKLGSASNQPAEWIRNSIDSVYSGPTFNSAISQDVENVIRPASGVSDSEGLKGPALLVSGLADNAEFCRSAERLGIESAGAIGFSDHFQYDILSVAKIADQAETLGAIAILTSAKDWVKLQEFNWELPVWIVSVSAEVEEVQAFYALVSTRIFPNAAKLN